jgi:hypothetical protein
MNFNFPDTKFVKENTCGDQIKHILSEADEVRKAKGDHLWDELMDLSHSLETLFRMQPKVSEAARLRVIEKNEARGYYCAPPASVNPATVKPANIVSVEDGYESLFKTLVEALNQAQIGKGKERHATWEPFDQQPIMVIADMFGEGYQLGQAVKKLQESQRLDKDAAIRERLGAINYIAASIIGLQR